MAHRPESGTVLPRFGQDFEAELPSGSAVGHCCRCSRSEGVWQLQNLAAYGDSEDAWVYLGSCSLWVDIGEKESWNSVCIDADFLTALLDGAGQGGECVSLFHIHPRSMLAGNRIYPPAANDIYSLVNLKRILREKSDAEITAYVLDGEGVWTYETTDLFESSYFQNQRSWQRCCSASDLAKEQYANFMLDYCTLVEPATSDIALSQRMKIEAYILRSRALGIEVSYTPH